MTREQLIEYEKNREQATITTFARLDASEESMLRGERQAVLMWLADAGTLVEEFRVTRQLFTSDRVRELHHLGHCWSLFFFTSMRLFVE